MFPTGTTEVTLDPSAALNTLTSSNNIYKYGTKLYFSKVCGPDLTKFSKLGPVSDLIKKTMGTMEKFIADLTRAYYVLAASFGAAIVIGLIYMLFLRICVGVLVFVTIMAIILG